MLERFEIEVFHGGVWHVAASVEARGLGRTSPTYLEYDIDYASTCLGAKDRRALSCRFPVDYGLHSLDTFPAFLCDLLPQGDARRVLEARLRNDGLGEDDWTVLRHGASSPVGNLRIGPPPSPAAPSRGFSREDVIERGDAFREWAESEGIPMTGSSDTGGASPKLLLTEDRDGRMHADGALPDALAGKHFIVKFARGRSRRDAQVLAHEPAYLELARRAGAHCGAELVHDRGALFVPRFDRVASRTRRRGEMRVERHGLESMYALCGVVVPGARLRWEDVCARVAAVVDDPLESIVEIVRREALSLALGNTDNHGRNTSLVKMADGGITLSPLYDFAPMFLDPELIKRASHWRSEKPGDPPDWRDVADTLGALVDRKRLVREMRALGAWMNTLPREMRRLAVDEEIVTRCAPWAEKVRDGLEALR